MDNNFKKERPKFPKRAVVTFGMPYGNKELHFGHLFGMILSADFFARFLKNRIGKENVLLQSGTDCYGSTMTMAFEKFKSQGKDFGTVENMIKHMHESNIETFKNAEIGYDFFGASAFGDAKENHELVSRAFFEVMKKSGNLIKMDTEQFFDEEKGCFLNGRQVVGKCPYPGCKSEKGYADECDMCHQYLPKDLIDPVSMLSGKTPVLKKITNWYFDIQEYRSQILELLNEWEKDKRNRKYVTKEIKEFLKKPEIYVKQEFLPQVEMVKNQFTDYEILDADSNKPSFTIVFDKLQDRERACEILNEQGVKFRNGKTLVPFRITGNIEWGVPVPNEDGMENLTFYVWPESLWSPISFTKTYLENNDNPSSKVEDWWCSEDAEVFQFIGEDNMYFYGAPELALFLSTQGKNPSIRNKNGNLTLPHLVVNKHSLYFGLKASSSGKFRAPLAKELFDYYTVDQLRMHFLGLGFGETNVNISLKPFNPDANPDEIDPALKEGNVLINVFNRVLRRFSFFIDEQFGGKLQLGTPSDDVLAMCEKEILSNEEKIYLHKFHVAVNAIDVFIRNINKYFDKESKVAIESQNEMQIKQVAINTLHMIRIATTLLNPFIPSGSQRVADYFELNEKWTDWNFIFDSPLTFVKTDKKIERLEDETPFFKKHNSQD